MIQKQPMMRKVLYALIPIFLFSIYLYGWRVLFLTAIIFPAGILVEYIFEKRKNKKVSEAVLVTCALYTLSMPPMVPWWIALIGIIFAVVFGKEVFGGFGKNPFNPAISGRLFVYLTFPGFMTSSSWATSGNFGLNIDSLTGATSLGLLRDGQPYNLLNQFLGFQAGSIGESSAILILLAAIYLIYTKTASWEIIVSTIGSTLILSAIFQYFKVPGALPVFASLLSGSFLFVAVFMATDPISGPKKKIPKWIYGVIIGVITVLIRTFNGELFPEATSFAILFGNTFALITDELFNKKKNAK